MPLVVPGVTSSLGDKSGWINKLMGKKISEGGSDEIVRYDLGHPSWADGTIGLIGVL